MTAAHLLTAADMARNTRVNRAAALADHGVDLDTHTVTFAGEARPRTDAERAERRAPIIARGQVAVAFGPRFDLESYALFLRAKTLPEWDLAYDWQTDTYVLSAPARYAAVLTGQSHEAPAVPTDLAPHLFDYQRWIVSRALAAQRFAIWADTGLGKTAMFLEWARQVVSMTGGRVLILSPLGIIEQTRAEAARFYGQDLFVERLDSRESLAAWCTGEGPSLGISNYDKLIPGQLPELRHLAGLVADESSLLRSGGGVIKWNLIKSARGIPWKLSCTATPAPNDTMEYASQAAFLEKIRTEGDVLWTYFVRDKSGEWHVKPHAREAFYRFMCDWSIYLRNPANYGWGDILASLPEPVYHEERLPLTPEQATAMTEYQVKAGSGFFSHQRMGVRERAKLSQLAKGFLYGDDKTAVRVPSLKPGRVAEIVRAEVAAGRAVLVWTVFDEESAIIAEHLADVPGVATLHGAMKPEDREPVIAAFKAGAVRVLLSKPVLIGQGLNFQHCRAMVFSGLDDSFERMYQAIRRCYRFGQTEPVHVYIPIIPELEGMIFENVKTKEGMFLRDVAEQERHYRAALKDELSA